MSLVQASLYESAASAVIRAQVGSGDGVTKPSSTPLTSRTTTRPRTVSSPELALGAEHAVVERGVGGPPALGGQGDGAQPRRGGGDVQGAEGRHPLRLTDAWL